MILTTQLVFAPKTNPAENVWDYLHKKDLAMLVYGSYGAIVEACCQAWNELMATSQCSVSLATRQWAEVS